MKGRWPWVHQTWPQDRGGLQRLCGIWPPLVQCRRPPNFQALQTEGTGPLDLFNTGRLGFAGLNNGQFGIVEAAGVDYGLVHNPTVEGEEIVTNGWTLQLGIPDASAVLTTPGAG